MFEISGPGKCEIKWEQKGCLFRRGVLSYLHVCVHVLNRFWMFLVSQGCGRLYRWGEVKRGSKGGQATGVQEEQLRRMRFGGREGDGGGRGYRWRKARGW